ncbi:hypothetical protein [Microbacterium sp. NIBRBAC000506063]|uniref:hypothetical protein n=1 Tax=Microbacterium sp. NIBRBAC000506063 TaxID=2734618 RepID=UPI001BB5A13A|nr:hypothetical protein [Microbacterium sp. NIBRBAC000506063]QTV79191.1 hypothetical protein KAE78_08965 [Microbacterium sp. NIBRBAC000506063]
MTAGIDWTVQAADFVLDTGRCPVCAEAALDQGHCLACGVDLSGTAGRDVLDASTAAARALRERERLLRAAHLARAAVPHTVRASSAVQPAAQPAASVAVAASAARRRRAQERPCSR